MDTNSLQEARESALSRADLALADLARSQSERAEDERALKAWAKAYADAMNAWDAEQEQEEEESNTIDESTLN